LSRSPMTTSSRMRPTEASAAALADESQRIGLVDHRVRLADGVEVLAGVTPEFRAPRTLARGSSRGGRARWRRCRGWKDELGLGAQRAAAERTMSRPSIPPSCEDILGVVLDLLVEFDLGGLLAAGRARPAGRRTRRGWRRRRPRPRTCAGLPR
jgi:hypothetical protein